MEFVNRRALAFLIAIVTSISAMGGLVGSAGASEGRMLTLVELAEIYGDDREPLTVPAGFSPAEAQAFLLNEHEVLGRAPNDWVSWAHSTYNFDTLPATATPGDLVSDVVRLNAMLGVHVTPTKVLQM